MNDETNELSLQFGKLNTSVLGLAARLELLEHALDGDLPLHKPKTIEDLDVRVETIEHYLDEVLELLNDSTFPRKPSALKTLHNRIDALELQLQTVLNQAEAATPGRWSVAMQLITTLDARLTDPNPEHWPYAVNRVNSQLSTVNAQINDVLDQLESNDAGHWGAALSLLNHRLATVEDIVLEGAELTPLIELKAFTTEELETELHRRQEAARRQGEEE